MCVTNVTRPLPLRQYSTVQSFYLKALRIQRSGALLSTARESWAGVAKDALERTVHAAEIGGLRAILAHVKDDSARVFYEHLNFEPSATDPYHLFMLVKDLKRMVR